MKVKNISGTGDDKCEAGCDNWQEHWRRATNKRKVELTCSANDCNKIATDGAHVKKCESKDNQTYIIPLCKKCNLEKKECFDIGNVELIPDTPQQTCPHNNDREKALKNKSNSY